MIITQIINYDNILSSIMEDLEDVTPGYSKEVILVTINQKVLTAEQAKTILTTRGSEDTETKQRIEMVELTATEGTNISVTQKPSLAWQGLAAKLGIPAGLLNVAAAGIAVLVAGVVVYKQYQQTREESRQAAQEVVNTYMDSIATIESYIAKYEELHTTLLKTKGNEEETYNIKEQLLDLQTGLNGKSGDEYRRLNPVTDAYEDHVDAIKAYNRNAAKTFLNNISYSDQNRSVDMMTKQKIYNLSIGDVSGSSEESLELQDLIGNYEDKGMTIQISSDGILWIYLNADPTDTE